MQASEIKQSAIGKFRDKTATIGIVGLGYVGLPLMLRYAETGFKVLGFDIDAEKVDKLNNGETYIEHITADKIAAARAAGFSVLQHSGSQKLAAQMKKADASGAKVALIVGEGELAEGKASLKDMQQGRGQVSVPAADLLQQLNEWIR